MSKSYASLEAVVAQGCVRDAGGSVEGALATLVDKGDCKMCPPLMGTRGPLLSLSTCDPVRLDEVASERVATVAPTGRVTLQQAFDDISPLPTVVQADANAYFLRAVFPHPDDAPTVAGGGCGGDAAAAVGGGFDEDDT